ncbi:MAG: hypothetical protein IJJ38_11600 [Lachnospiraceae bacterium]|nr:hypothetical protein [Lachnospiraceae bacterium]
MTVPEIIRSLAGMSLRFQGGSWFLFAAAAVLIPLFLTGGKTARVVLVCPLLLSGLIFFNPWLIRAFYRSAESLPAPHIYTFWMFPAALILAAGCIAACAKLPAFSMKIPLILAVVLFSVLTGVPRVQAYRSLSLPVNVKKADPELLAISGYLAEKSRSDSYRVFFESGRMALEAGELDAHIIPEPFALEADSTLTVKTIERRIREAEGGYIVCDADGELAAYLFGRGLQKIAHTPRSSVYYIGET